MQIESLPTRSNNEAPLQNVLSISTAGKNRYLLHFNSHHSLIQWTAGIRLAMFEHATLQEAYTGALIAGKGKALNNINIIMERSKLRTADWARVRFGAGTPWRRCWCVITPPDEKEMQKLQKQVNKKKSAYDKSRLPISKGDIKFYDTKKTKKVRPIATITDAYSAFAIYPQSKPLIDASTLVKVEGSITIHSNPPSTTEGFVFVMPEVHPAVTGFEMMLRWLFPVFDTFGLYGRPGRLVADTADPRSLMFAMPKHRRYGYLEILDISGLILEQGSSSWKESEWRRRMKDLTGKRMTAIENGSRTNSRFSSRRSARNSFGPSRSRIQFDDGASIRSSPSVTWNQGPAAEGPYGGIPRTDSAPPTAAFTPPRSQSNPHHRSVSESQAIDRFHDKSPSNYDGAYDQAPTPPPHAPGLVSGREGSALRYQNEMGTTPERISSEDETSRETPVRELQELQATTTPEPVVAPPAFAHAPGSLPISKPYHSPELRRANSRMSTATLSQLAGAGGVASGAYYANGVEKPMTSEEQRHLKEGRYSEERSQRGVLSDANTNEFPANQNGLIEGLTTVSNPRFSFENSSPSRPANVDSRTNYSQSPPQFPFSSSGNLGPNSPAEPSRSGAPPVPAKEQGSHNRTYEPPNVYASLDSNSQSPRHQQESASQGHFPQPSTDSTHSTTSQPSRIQTSQSIIRKPLPPQTSVIQTPTSAKTPSSTGSLREHVIDQAAFDLIGREDRKLTASYYESQVHRQNSGISSVYDPEDTASTASPDYTSPKQSIEIPRTVERPRAGVMKTVGDAEADEAQHRGGKATSSLVPDIDFGPTFNYAANRIPRDKSPVRGPSPGPSQAYNFPAGKVREQSPAKRPGSSGHSRSPSRNPIRPNLAHNRNDSATSRTVAWQPGMSAVGGNVPGSRHSITAEQFVQQRAAAAAPVFSHQRQPSGNVLRPATPTAPQVTRRKSTDILAQQGHSRNNSADLLQRPHSRGPSVALGPSGSGDIASSLSAREQEHIAKMTGQPLISMAQNANKGAPGSGLVGAIDARERDRQQMKQGIRSQAAQQVIAQRKQTAAYQQQPEQMPTEYRAPQSQFGGNMSQYPQSQFPVQAQRQQQWVSPAANVFAQGGGWSAPSPNYATPPLQDPVQGGQSPLQYPPQQQYFPPQPQPGPQARGHAGFHGHGT